MNERLSGLASLGPEMNSLRAEMNGHFDEMNSRFDSLNVLIYALGAGIIAMLTLQALTLLQVVAPD